MKGTLTPSDTSLQIQPNEEQDEVPSIVDELRAEGVFGPDVLAKIQDRLARLAPEEYRLEVARLERLVVQARSRRTQGRRKQHAPVTFGEGLGPKPGFASVKHTVSFAPGEIELAEAEALRERATRALGVLWDSVPDKRIKWQTIRYKLADHQWVLDNAEMLKGLSRKAGSAKAKVTRVRNQRAAAQVSHKVAAAEGDQVLWGSRWFLIQWFRKDAWAKLQRLPQTVIYEVVAHSEAPMFIGYARLYVLEDGAARTAGAVPGLRDQFGRLCHLPISVIETVHSHIGGVYRSKVIPVAEVLAKPFVRMWRPS